MKKGAAFYICRFILTAVAVFSFYMFDSDTAMAEVQKAVQPAAESESEQPVQPAAESESEQPVQSTAGQEQPEAEPKQPEQPVGGAKQSVAGAEQSVVGSELEQPVQSATEPEAYQPVQSATEPEACQPVQFAAEPEAYQPVQSPAEPEEGISTGQELAEWLDSHKKSGGTVKLTDHVTLDEHYEFSSAGAEGSTLFVDTGKYTITVTGEVELMSDQHLIFSGQPDGKGIFCAASNGMLFLRGVTVESGGGALWQEEGAGLAVSGCSVSGDVHYADTPFVTFFQNSVCAVVEKEQTLNDALPLQMNCEVNRRGELSENELVDVSWNQEGSEKQQEERRRFMLQGSFSGAASARTPLCTVVYNDYPLTFTDVEAEAKGSLYIFKGGFTVPEESLPFTVLPEYSFDGENWFPETEQLADNTDAAFCMVCPCEQSGSSIYIRLQWNNNGTVYFSNVLRYSSDNLECVEDIGGSRGGGTSIINPPDEPQKSDDTVSPGEKDGDSNEHDSTNSDNAAPEGASDSKKTGSGHRESRRDAADGGVSGAEAAYTGEEPQQRMEVPDTGEEPQQSIDIPNTGEKPQQSTEVPNTSEEPQQRTEVPKTGQGLPAEAALSEYYEEQVLYAEPKTEAFSKTSERTLQVDSRLRMGVIFAAGAVVLSAAGGIAVCYVHSRSGTKR